MDDAVLLHQLVVLAHRVADVLGSFIDVKVVGVAPFPVAGFEVLLVRLHGRGDDVNGRIDLLDLLVNDPVSLHVVADPFARAVWLVAQVDDQRAVFAVLVEEIVDALAERLLVVGLFPLLDRRDRRAGEHAHAELLDQLDARRLGFVGRFGRPAAPDAAGPNAQAVGKLDVFAEAVVPIATRERDFLRFVAFGLGFRQDGERGVVAERFLALLGDRRVQFVIAADLQGDFAQVDGRLVDEPVVLLFLAFQGRGRGAHLLGAPVIAHHVRERVLVVAQRFDRLDGDINPARIVGKEEIAELRGREKQARDAVVLPPRRGEISGREIVHPEASVGLVELDMEARGLDPLGHLNALAQRLPVVLAE